MAQNSASRKRLHHRHPPPVAQVRHECDAAGPGRSSAVRLWAMSFPLSRVPTAKKSPCCTGDKSCERCAVVHLLFDLSQIHASPEMSNPRLIGPPVGRSAAERQKARSSLISPGGESPPRECHTLRRAPSVLFSSSATLRQIHNATMM